MRSVDVPVGGMKRLELETRTELAKLPTLFWANARIITADGRELALGELPVRMENLRQPGEPGAMASRVLGSVESSQTGPYQCRSIFGGWGTMRRGCSSSWAW